MTLPHLALNPDSESYQQQEGNEVIGVALDGGAGRFRRDKIGAARTVNVQWTMNPYQYRYWRAFWHTATKRGSLPFTCNLVGEDGLGPAKHECHFMPGTVSMPQQIGLTYIQAATLEVKPLPVNDDYNAGIILEFTSDLDMEALFPLVDHLVNVTTPEALGA